MLKKAQAYKILQESKDFRLFEQGFIADFLFTQMGNMANYSKEQEFQMFEGMKARAKYLRYTQILTDINTEEEQFKSAWENIVLGIEKKIQSWEQDNSSVYIEDIQSDFEEMVETGKVRPEVQDSLAKVENRLKTLGII